jgi:hypothetical protein
MSISDGSHCHFKQKKTSPKTRNTCVTSTQITAGYRVLPSLQHTTLRARRGNHTKKIEQAQGLLNQHITKAMITQQL